jgi:hypothetical protein
MNQQQQHVETFISTTRSQKNDNDDEEQSADSCHDDDDNVNAPSNDDNKKSSEPDEAEIKEIDGGRARIGAHRERVVERQLDAIVRIAKDISQREFRAGVNSYVPEHVMRRFEDPFIALTHCVDIELEYEKGAAEMAEAMADFSRRVEPVSKRGSLKRTISKSLRISNTIPIAPSLASIENERVTASLISEEARSVSKRLSDLCHPFAVTLCRLARIRNQLQAKNVLQFMPYVLIHTSVARHPRLMNLKIGDNSMIIEVGRACARTFVLLESYAQVYRIDNAERRWETFNHYAGVWFIKQCGKEKSRDLVSVDWRLDAQTHQPLPGNVVQERIQVMTGEMPFIMIGVLHTMGLYDARDNLLWSMYQDLI